MIDRFFGLSRNGTSVRTEIIAGVTLVVKYAFS